MPRREWIVYWQADMEKLDYLVKMGCAAMLPGMTVRENAAIRQKPTDTKELRMKVNEYIGRVRDFVSRTDANEDLTPLLRIVWDEMQDEQQMAFLVSDWLDADMIEEAAQAWEMKLGTVEENDEEKGSGKAG